MTSKQTVIHFVIVLFSVSVLVQGILFGGPSGELLPNNPQKCTGQNITFTCKVNGHSSSTLRFKLNDNDPLPDNETVIIDDSTRSLTLTDLTMDNHHLNVLCCMNYCNKSFDIVGSTQLLRMYEYPTSVVNFSCVLFGWSNEMSCTYGLGQHYQELPNVALRWSIPSLSGSWNDCQDFDTVSKTECKWHNQSVSDRNVKIQIDITSRCGISVPEQVFEVNTSLIVKPHPLPEIRVLAVKSTCIQVTWDNPVFNQLKEYRIEISSHWSEDIEPYFEVETMDTRKNESTHVFCDLVPNTEYTVTGYIKPAIEGYWSEEKVAPEVMTPKDVPYQSPDITEGAYKWDPAQCEADGKRTIYLYFNSIPKRYQNGDMKAIVARSDTPFLELTSKTETEIPPDHTQLGVQVKCGTDHNFFLSGRNEIGESEVVSKIFVPKASSEPKVPELIIETLDHKIYLNWSADVSKKVTGYTLFWCKKYSGNCQMDAIIHWKKLPGDSETAILEIPSPEDYLYSVSMETQQGSTGMTWESCIYAKNAEPQQHPETPTVSRSLEDNTLAVFWNKIECESGAPYIVSYKVIYCIWAKHANNCSGERSELIVPSTQTSVVLKGLKEDQEYGVIIHGLTADGQESPYSDPAFGTPVNTSLKAGAIIGIAAGCLFGLIFVIAGIFAIGRYCKKTAKEKLSDYPIDDVLNGKLDNTQSNRLNGCYNQVFSGYELPNGFSGGNQNYTEVDSIYISNGKLPQPPPRAERQESKDSGIPDDPLTPRNADDRMQFPSTIDEQKPGTPLTPDGNFDPKWHMNMLPNGYTRVKTDDDNIPRISVHRNSSDYIGHGGPTLPKQDLNAYAHLKPTTVLQNLTDNTYIPNDLTVSMPIVPKPDLIVMTAFQPENPVTISRPEARDANTAGEGSGQTPATSYTKATMVQTEDVTDKDKAQGLNDGKSTHIPEELVAKKTISMRVSTEADRQGAAEDNKNTNDGILSSLTKTVFFPNTGEANQQASDYLPNDIAIIGNTGNSPTRLANDTGGYVTHENAQMADTDGYLPHNHMATSDSQDSRSHPYSSDKLVPRNANTDDVVSLSKMQHVNSGSYNPQSSMTTPKSDSGSSHPNSVDTFIATATNIGGYVSQSEMHPSNTSDNVSHGNISSPNSGINKSHANSVATPSNAGGYVSHPEMKPANTTLDYVTKGNIPTPNSGKSRSHTNSIATPSNTGGYVSHTEMQPTNTSTNFATSNSGNRRSHPKLVDTPCNTAGYVSQSEMQPTNTTLDYVSHGNIAAPNSGNSRSHSNSVAPPSNAGGYVSHSVMQPTRTSDYVTQDNSPTSISGDNRSHNNAVATPDNTDGYVSHSEMRPTDTTDYISQDNIATPNSGINRSHANLVAISGNTSSYVSHSKMQPDNTTDYVSHGNITTPNSDIYRSNANSAATHSSAGGYVSHSEIKPASTTDYISHDSIATPNSGNSRSHPNSVSTLADSHIACKNETDAKTSGYISHEVAQTANINNSIPNIHNETSSSDTDMPHADAAALVSGSCIPQTDPGLANTGDYLPHNDVVVENGGYEPQSDIATHNASGYVSPADTTNVHLDRSPSHTVSATVNTSDYLPNEETHIPSNETGVYLQHKNTGGAKTGDYVPVNGINPPSSEFHVNSNDYIPHQILSKVANDSASDRNSDRNGTDDTVINEIIGSQDKKSKTNGDGIIKSSGNTVVSDLHVPRETQTNSSYVHGKALDSCKDCLESAKNAHNDSNNCNLQSAAGVIKSDYVSHDSAIIQSSLKPEETVDNELKDENRNPTLEENVSVMSKQNDPNCKCLGDKTNNNVTRNLNETATGGDNLTENVNETAVGSNNLTRTLNENDRRIIRNTDGYVGLDQLQKVSVGQGTVKPVNGYITADLMQNLHNQNHL